MFSSFPAFFKPSELDVANALINKIGSIIQEYPESILIGGIAAVPLLALAIKYFVDQFDVVPEQELRQNFKAF